MRSDNEISKGNPIIINNQFSSPASDRPEKDNNTSLNGISDWLLALFTLLLVVVAVLQWITMRGHARELKTMATHMKSGLEETTKAANAASHSAKTAEQTFIASHRPRLTVRFMSEQGIEQVNPISGRFLLFNTGDTKAKLISGYSDVVFYLGNLPAATPYEGKNGVPFVDVELLPGDSVPVIFPTVPQEQEPGEIRIMTYRNGNIYVVGWITYSDPSGRVHRKGFAHRYNRKTQRFERETDEDYEFDD